MDCVGYVPPTTSTPTTTEDGTTTTMDDSDGSGETDNANNYAFTFLSFGLTTIFAALKLN